jgi:lysyl-tRNA synthetase class 2
VAIINILSTLFPVWPMRYHLLAHGLPLSLIFFAQHIALFAGVTMLLLAYPAALGHRRATYLLMACTTVAIFANLLKGLDVEEALINAVLLAALWRGRRALHTIPMRYTAVDLVRLAVLLVVITRLYDLLGSFILRGLHLLVAGEEHAFPRVDLFVHILTAKLPLQHAWFTESQLLLPTFLVGIFLVLSWTSLVRAVAEHTDGEDLYERFGRASHNSLAYLARRGDVSTFVDPAGQGAISYRQVGRVALQVGAILARREQREAVYRAFLEHCRAHRLIPAAVALTSDERAIAQRAGMHSVNIGSEAVVALADFSVETLGKKMRWAQRSLAKRGCTCMLLSAADVSAPLRSALDAIDDEWRQTRGGQSHGFCMTLGRFPTLDDRDCLIAVASDADGVPIAYLTLLPGGYGYYSLDLTRRRRDAPNATMEYLLMEVLSQLQARGATTVSLNFSTLSSLASARAGRATLAIVGKALQLHSLEAFNAKFHPEWAPRYLAVRSWRHLPDVLYAILVLEGVDRMLLNALVRALRHTLRPSPRRRLEPSLQVQGDGV